MKANQIDKITVVTNPSSRYASTVGSIIKITTIKKVGDGFSFDNIATFGYRNYLYGKDNLDLNYRADKFDVFGTFGFEKGKDTNSSKNVQNSWFSSHHQQNTTMKSTQHSKLIDGKWGFDFPRLQNSHLAHFTKYLMLQQRPILALCHHYILMM